MRPVRRSARSGLASGCTEKSNKNSFWKIMKLNIFEFMVFVTCVGFLSGIDIFFAD